MVSDSLQEAGSPQGAWVRAGSAPADGGPQPLATMSERSSFRVKAGAGWVGGAAVIASRGVQLWRVVVRGDRGRTRWLADAEADHSGGVTRAESGAQGPGAGAAAAEE